MTLRKDIEEIFKKYRFDKETHLDLGDIRLSIGEQETIADQICKLFKERLEKCECVGADYLCGLYDGEDIRKIITELSNQADGSVDSTHKMVR